MTWRGSGEMRERLVSEEGWEEEKGRREGKRGRRQVLGEGEERGETRMGKGREARVR